MHVQRKLKIQFFCFYLLMTAVATFRAARFVMYGENPKRTVLTSMLMAILYVLDKVKTKYPSTANSIGQFYLTLWHVGITEFGVAKATYQLDIAMIVIYVFHFSVVANSWIKFYYSWFFFSCCTLYYVGRNYARYGLEEGLVVFVVFISLAVMNFFYCLEHEVNLREDFMKTTLIKQFKNSLHSVLDVFPEGILVKSNEAHHYSNDALAQKLNSTKEEFG